MALHNPKLKSHMNTIACFQQHVHTFVPNVELKVVIQTKHRTVAEPTI